jgi:Mg-chelatase subunit ChlD
VGNDTQLAVRLLRDACLGCSEYQFFGSDVDSCAAFINGIRTNGGTPLFNTIKDALHTTMQQQAAERTIFVLTDGDDTCGNEIENVLAAEEINWIKQINVIIAQYAISELSDVKKLSHLAKIIGAKTINFGKNSSSNRNYIRNELKLELKKIGLNGNA